MIQWPRATKDATNNMKTRTSQWQPKEVCISERVFGFGGTPVSIAQGIFVPVMPSFELKHNVNNSRSTLDGSSGSTSSKRVLISGVILILLGAP